MIPGKPFDPATRTSRRPTPEKFAHLRRWVEPIVRDIKLTTITEITNVNEQLTQSAELYINNIINRVIAQLIGEYEDGFITIQSTVDGALHVHQTNDPAAPDEIKKAVINFATAATHSIITAVPDKKHKITTILLTVAGETNLTFLTAATPLSGALDFGGTNEPRGMVTNHGSSPLECAINEAFQITSSGAVQVSGYVIYYTE